MRLSFKKILLFVFFAALVGFAAVQIFSINRSARKTLESERARLTAENRVPFEKRTLAPLLSPHLAILQSVSDTRDFVRFGDSYFAATDGGLVRYSETGEILKHFTVLDGLPESDLTCLAVFGGKLFIGTRTKNLIVFDGERFEKYVWIHRQAQAVTALLETDGKLLIGTFAGGLFEFDNQNFTEIKAADARILKINCLFKNGARLFVGTFDNGLWIYENNVWSHLTRLDNLPSNRIVGIAVKDEKIFVATDFGLAVREGAAFRHVAVVPSLSSLISHNGEIFLTKDNGEVFRYDQSLKEFSTPEPAQNARLISFDDRLWLLNDKGVSVVGAGKIKSFSPNRNEPLTDNFVSAIAFDRRENLWIGTFRNGIDVISGGTRRHFELEEIREINYLESNGENVYAAASSGLIRFKNDFSFEKLTKKDGLPSSSVTHFAGEFVATAKGLAFRENGRLRVISTVQGLPSNSVSTLLQRSGKKLYAGTLGGLAEIESGRVARVFKDSNLTTNWVTSLCAANERLFIGTYGGGVFELLPSGEIRSFEPEIGKFAVNPNAMFADGERLYVGTLTGVKTLDLKTQEWKTHKNFLPAETVLAVAGDAENVYFGTTNGIAKVNKNYFAKGE